MFMESELISYSTAQVVVLTFARCLGTALTTPTFGGIEVSKMVRALLAVLLTAIAAPLALANNEVFNEAPSLVSLCALVAGVVKEGILGASVGLVLRVFFEGVYLAGETIAKIGGISVGESFDWNFGGEVSSVSRLLFWISFALFIAVGGVERFVDGLLSVFMNAPVALDFAPEDLISVIVNVLTASFGLALKIAAPVIISTSTIYLAVGFLGRVFPQLNLASIAFSGNSLLALTVLTLAIGGICQCYQDGIATALETALTWGGKVL